MGYSIVLVKLTDWTASRNPNDSELNKIKGELNCDPLRI